MAGRVGGLVGGWVSEQAGGRQVEDGCGGVSVGVRAGWLVGGYPARTQRVESSSPCPSHPTRALQATPTHPTTRLRAHQLTHPPTTTHSLSPLSPPHPATCLANLAATHAPLAPTHPPTTPLSYITHRSPIHPAGLWPHAVVTCGLVRKMQVGPWMIGLACVCVSVSVCGWERGWARGRGIGANVSE